MTGPSMSGGKTLLSQLGFSDKDRASSRHDLAVAYAMERRADLAAMLTPAPSAAWNEVGTRLARSGLSCAVELRCEVRVCRPDLRAFGVPSPFLIGFADGVLLWTQSDRTYEGHCAEHESRERVARHFEQSLHATEAALVDVNEKVRESWRAEGAASLCLGLFDEQRTLNERKRSDEESLETARRRVFDLAFDPVECAAILEVKIARVPAGDIVRQVEAYRGGITACGVDLRGKERGYDMRGGHHKRRPAIALLDFGVSKSERELLVAAGVTPLRLGAAFEDFIAKNDQKVEIGEL